MRRARLVFYEDDLQRIQAPLEGALSAARLDFVLLVHVEGHPITQVGSTEGVNLETIAALAAASFAACKETSKVSAEEPLDEVRLLSGTSCSLLRLIEPDLRRTIHEVADLYLREAVQKVCPLLCSIRQRTAQRRAELGDDDDDLTGPPARLRPGDPPRAPRPELGAGGG